MHRFDQAQYLTNQVARILNQKRAKGRSVQRQFLGRVRFSLVRGPLRRVGFLLRRNGGSGRAKAGIRCSGDVSPPSRLENPQELTSVRVAAVRNACAAASGVREL